MKMKLHNICLITALSTLSINVIAADSCSPQENHQSKFDKYSIQDVPSLLEDCGIGLSISIPTLTVPGLGDGDLFCGFNLSDLSDFYSGAGGAAEAARRLADSNNRSRDGYTPIPDRPPVFDGNDDGGTNPPIVTPPDEPPFDDRIPRSGPHTRSAPVSTLTVEQRAADIEKKNKEAAQLKAKQEADKKKKLENWDAHKLF
ncbi:MAG: cell envelope integrity protein TolA [Endozoicomonadaceae bacterium]|nr:cell envelope integrity protein TolA [Endozoicomonadaceae bacterium]